MMETAEQGRAGVRVFGSFAAGTLCQLGARDRNDGDSREGRLCQGRALSLIYYPDDNAVSPEERARAACASAGIAAKLMVRAGVVSRAINNRR
jgi:hypothetical protein